MFFKTFPKTLYEFKALGKTHELVDIFARARFDFSSVFSQRPYIEHTVRQGDTADIIAHMVYGSSDWWWLVLLYNDIVNPFADIPRLGFDKEFSNVNLGGQDRSTPAEPARIKRLPGTTKRITKDNPVVYLSRHSGDDKRDFQKGDVLIKAKTLGMDSVTYNVVGKKGNLKTLKSISGPELTDAEADRSAVEIIQWDFSKREAILDSKGHGSFGEGDYVAVLEKDNEGVVRAVLSGTIEKYYSNPKDSISHFVDRRTGARVSANYNPDQDKYINFSPIVYAGVSGGSGVSPTMIHGTILDRVMETGTQTDEMKNYIPINEDKSEEEKEQGVLQDTLRSRIRLLDPSYKYEAYRLIDKLMRGQRSASYQSLEYSTTKRVRNIRGSGGTSTDRIY